MPSAAELMQFLFENVLITDKIIDISDVNKNMKEMELKKILQNHHYSITKSRDERWWTYVPDETKKSGRRQIAKSTKEKLEEELYLHYTGEKNQLADSTLRELYPKWKAHKETISAAEINIIRINSEWNRYYADSDIVDIPVKDLKKIKIEEWVHTVIKHNDMSRKQYGNFSLIIRQMLDYAVDLEIVGVIT